MVAELELQHYQVKVGYLGFMNQYFICVQLISWLISICTKTARKVHEMCTFWAAKGYPMKCKMNDSS